MLCLCFDFWDGTGCDLCRPLIPLRFCAFSASCSSLSLASSLLLYMTFSWFLVLRVARCTESVLLFLQVRTATTSCISSCISVVLDLESKA